MKYDSTDYVINLFFGSNLNHRVIGFAKDAYFDVGKVDNIINTMKEDGEGNVYASKKNSKLHYLKITVLDTSESNTIFQSILDSDLPFSWAISNAKTGAVRAASKAMYPHAKPIFQVRTEEPENEWEFRGVATYRHQGQPNIFFEVGQ